MHPIERIRSLARATWLDPATVAVEGADAIADTIRWIDEPTAVSIARRLLAWHPLCGPLWWAAGEILHALDPAATAAEVVDALLTDPTATMIDAALAEGARPLVVGEGNGLADFAEASGLALGDRMGSWHRRGGEADWDVNPDAVADTTTRASHVLLGALALGPGGAVVRRPGRLAAEAAARSDTPVWVVAGVGTVVDAALWERMEAVIAAGRIRPESKVRSDAWWDDADDISAPAVEIVAPARVTFVCGPDGLMPWPDVVATAPTSPSDLLDAAGATPF